jgi:amino acid adenylation domain-containing protein
VKRRATESQLGRAAGSAKQEISMEGHDVLRAFAGSVAQGPARTALEHGERCVSYRDLDRWTTELAHVLRPAGPRAVVAVCATDALEWAAALIGVLKAGCVFAPLDLAQPPERRRAVLARLAPSWFVGAPGAAGEDAACNGLPGDARRCHLDAARLTVTEDTRSPTQLRERAAPASESAASACLPGELCYVFQTSGSTGAPKLIAGSYEAIGHFVRWETALLGLEPGTRVGQLTAPHFDAYLRDIFTPLACGGTVCIPPAADLRLSAAALAEWIDGREIHLLHLVPSLFHLLASGDLHPRMYPRLRHVLLAGEPPLPADLARWFGVFGQRVRIFNLYGPSETTMTKLCHEVKPADLERRSIPIGKAMDGAAVVLANRRGRLCAPGTVGEILLRSPYRSLGYFAQPELTAAAFVRNPWSDDPADLVYRTGDLGRLLPDGDIELLGRRDLQVKIRGQRVEIGEIESALGEHPQVLAAAVVARLDGAGLPALCAFVVTPDELAPRELRDWLLARLPAALVPDRFVRLPELPLLRNGKVDRRALAAADLARLATQPRLAAQTPTQQRLTAIWEEVIQTQGAGIRDEFFAVGGHSLLATRLLLRVREVFGVEVPLTAFFDRPTIEDLAASIEELTLAQADPMRLEELLREIEGGAPPAPCEGSAG